MNPKILTAIGVALVVIGVHDTFPASDGTFRPWLFTGSAWWPVASIGSGAFLLGRWG